MGCRERYDKGDAADAAGGGVSAALYMEDGIEGHSLEESVHLIYTYILLCSLPYVCPEPVLVN
eukprot:COSAG06_NODE_8202_length_2239_cov_3.221963_2_plen_63_part_00